MRRQSIRIARVETRCRSIMNFSFISITLIIYETIRSVQLEHPTLISLAGTYLDDNAGCSAPYASRNQHICVHITCLASHFLPLAFAGNSHATLPRDYHTNTFSTYYYLFIFLFVCLLMYRENEWMNEKTKFALCPCIIITCASTRIHILLFVLLSFFFFFPTNSKSCILDIVALSHYV